MSLPTAKEAGEYIDQYLGTSAAVKSFKAEFLAKKLTQMLQDQKYQLKARFHTKFTIGL